MTRTKSLLLAAVAAMSFGVVGTVAAQTDPMVGGAEMYRSKTIVENAMNSPDHTTLVTAVKAAGLVDTLSGPGPFTVFAPTNEAFAKVPRSDLEGMLNQSNHATLRKVLTYHVVPGAYDRAAILSAIKDGGGKATLTTVQGEPLIVTMSGGQFILTDAHNGNAHVTIADVYQSNGVIHVIDTVLAP